MLRQNAMQSVVDTTIEDRLVANAKDTAGLIDPGVEIVGEMAKNLNGALQQGAFRDTEFSRRINDGEMPTWGEYQNAVKTSFDDVYNVFKETLFGE